MRTVCVAPLLEVALESAGSPVAKIAADLALVLKVEAMKLVKPVGDRLPGPVQRHLLRIIDGLFPLVLLRLALWLVLTHFIFHFLGQLLLRPRLLLLNLCLARIDYVAQHIAELRHLMLYKPNLLPQFRSPPFLFAAACLRL